MLELIRDKKVLRYKVVIEISSFMLILLLAYTGLSKLLEHASFHAVMMTMPYLKYAEPALSWFLPVVEITVALLLCIDRFRTTALTASLILLVAFTVYLITMKISGEHLPCSCGGVIQYLSWTQHIFFNLLFILIAVTGLIYKIKEEKNDDINTSHPLLPT